MTNPIQITDSPTLGTLADELMRPTDLKYTAAFDSDSGSLEPQHFFINILPILSDGEHITVCCRE